jgi:type IV pilus assembly protein PilM
MGRVRRMGPSAIGLDVGRHSIRLARLGWAGSQPSLDRLGQTVTPAGQFDAAGWLQSPDALAECVRQLAAETGVSGCPVILGVGGPLVWTRTVPLPAEGGVQAALEALNGDLPLPVSELHATLHPLSGEVDPPQALLVAAPAKLVSELVGAVERAGLEPEVVDLLGFAAVYALLEQLHDGLPRLVGDWGAGGVTWWRLRGDEVRESVYVPGGGEAQTTALRVALSADLATADRLKRERLSLLPEHDESDTVPESEAAVRSLRQAVESSLEPVLSCCRADDPPVEILLHGGAARLRGLSAQVAAECGVPARVAEPFQSFGQEVRATLPASLTRESAEYLNVLGLAWRPIRVEG